MKQHLLGFFLILSNLCVGQSYVPLLSEANEWYVGFIGEGFAYSNHYYMQDTTINNSKFVKLYEVTHNFIPYMFGYLSEDTASRRVYFYDKDNNDGLILGSKKLIYAFNLNIGDSITVFNLFLSETAATLVLRKINIGQLAGINQPVLQMMPNERVFALTNPSNPIDTINWIEGTGSIGGLLYPLHSALHPYTQLTCHFRDGQLIYHDNALCDVFYFGIPAAKDEDFVRIYPNPVVDELHISLLQPAYGVKTIEILDIWGRVIQAHTMDETLEEFTIPTAALENGVYVIRMGMGDRFLSKYFIK